jgi:hypothetical protein
MSENPSEPSRPKVDMRVEDAVVRRMQIGHGVWYLSLWVPVTPYPVGHLWFANFLNTYDEVVVEVYQSFVSPFARRQGVRTRLNDELFTTFKAAVLMTGDGSKDGIAFMRATGYKLDEATGYWRLLRAEWQSRSEHIAE